MNELTIVIYVVLAGQMLLAFQLASWRSLFEMLALDVAFVLIYLTSILLLA